MKAEITRVSINHYNLGAYSCHKFRNSGGVSIYVHQSLQYTPMDFEEFCINQVIEVCAVKLYYCTNNICILTIYRAPTGTFSHFLKSLEAIYINKNVTVRLCTIVTQNC
jgi:hypothetical protein